MALNSERRDFLTNPEQPKQKEPTVIFPPRFENVNPSIMPKTEWLPLFNDAGGRGYTPHHFQYTPGIEETNPKKYQAIRKTVEKFLFDDPFGQSERAVPFGIFDSTSSEKKWSGGLRAIFGEEEPTNGLPPLEIMAIVKPEILHRAIGNTSLDKVCEVGRVVVPLEYRQHTTAIIKQLFDGENGLIQTVQERGIEKMIWIAQNRFTRHARQTSLEISDPIEIELQPSAGILADMFGRYWKDEQDPPKLHVAKIPPKTKI